MLHEDFAEIYKITSKMPYKKHISEISVLGYLQRVCYAKSPNNNDARNDNVIVVTESSDHDRVASISCLLKVIYKIEHMHEKTYENVYVCSDGMRSQFISRYIFKLLASKGPRWNRANGKECHS